MIFKNKDSLDPEFMPSGFLHREDEINVIKESIRPVYHGNKGDNLFLYGSPGVGKTACTKFVLQQFENSVYINCWLHRTAHNIIVEIARQLEIPVASKGKSTDEVVELILKRRDLAIVLDEADKAENISDLYPIVEKTNSVFIFITNSKDWILRIEPRMSSRLFLSEREFKPYSFKQMHDIVKERSKMAMMSGVMKEDALTEIARRAYLRQDVRVALFLMQKMGQKAELENLKNITMEMLKNAGPAFRKKAILNENEKIIVNVLKENEGKTTGEIYELFSKQKDLTERAFRLYLKRLEDKNVIRTETTGRGFKGRSRRIYLNKDYEV